MNKTILSDIKKTKALYPVVFEKVCKYSYKCKVFDKHFLKKKDNLMRRLYKITGKDIALIESCFSEMEIGASYTDIYSDMGYLDHLSYISFRVSLPEPKIIESISQEEISEIYDIVKTENYGIYANDYFERKFFKEFNDYFEKLLDINLQYLLCNTDDKMDKSMETIISHSIAL